jgi:molecular chaperone DnaK
MHPIGIDLGTTYSAIAKWSSTRQAYESKPYTINSEGKKTLPSKVFIDADEDGIAILTGSQALKKTISNPEYGIVAVKRAMDDIDANTYTIHNQTYTPIDISAEILKALLNNVEKIERPGAYVPEGIVVTVPIYFKQHQNLHTRRATEKALKSLYGKRVDKPESLLLELLPEAIAAGLDFAFMNIAESFKNQKFLIFDLGGGTLDITIFSLSQNTTSLTFEVLGISGHDRLGGEDFDEALADWVWEHEGVDLSTFSEYERKNILKASMPVFTDAKEVLSSMAKTYVGIPAKTQGMKAIDMDNVRRKDFEWCMRGKEGKGRDFVGEVEMKIQEALNKANLKASDIESVLLTGGSSKIPLFERMIEDFFGSTKTRQMPEIDLSVARGASVYAAYLLDKKLEAQGKPRKYLTQWQSINITYPTSHAIGIATAKSPFYMLIKDNVITPVNKHIPIIPSEVSEDGTRFFIDEVEVLQGNKERFSKVGNIKIGKSLFTHGRLRQNIKGSLTLTVEARKVLFKIVFPKSKEDQSDFGLTGELTLSN